MNFKRIFTLSLFTLSSICAGDPDMALSAWREPGAPAAPALICPAAETPGISGAQPRHVGDMHTHLPAARRLPDPDPALLHWQRPYDNVGTTAPPVSPAPARKFAFPPHPKKSFVKQYPRKGRGGSRPGKRDGRHNYNFKGGKRR